MLLVKTMLETEAVMAGEDFGLYGRTEQRANYFVWLGGVEPNQYDAAMQSGATLPSLHSSKFAPDYKKALPTGITAMSNAAVAIQQKINSLGQLSSGFSLSFKTSLLRRFSN